jgi:hypothetical protein
MSASSHRSWIDDGRATLAVVVVAGLITMLGIVPVRSAAAGLRLEAGGGGEIALDARGVPVGQVLDAVAEHGGFDVVMARGITRPPVNLTVPMAPIEDVLLQILRGRNYAVIYDGDRGAVSRVIVLRPSTASRSSARAARPRRNPQRPRSAVVIRR